jgi:hypothetical protein
MSAQPAAEASLSKDRRAQIFVGGKNRNIRVSHPGHLTPEDIRRVDDKLVSVIKDLTGCACLSGTIDVIWERDFENVLDVKLGAAYHG